MKLHAVLLQRAPGRARDPQQRAAAARGGAGGEAEGDFGAEQEGGLARRREGIGRERQVLHHLPKGIAIERGERGTGGEGEVS